MNLQRMLRPKCIAVVGISLNNDRHPANIIFTKNHYRNPVKVYPVNPKGGKLHGERVYTSISEIPQPVDLAVISARAEFCPGILKECIDSNVGGAAVISGGFAETGNSDLQKTMVQMAKEADFPFIGPNCLGLYVPEVVDTFFLPSERIVKPFKGNVAIVSQSGGILVDQMVKFSGEGVGISLGLSIGNKAIIGEIELLQYLIQDNNTQVITFYIEGFGNNEGRDFMIAAGKSPKPVVVMKAGKSAGGSRAVTSHTASIGGNYKIFSDIALQHGVIEAKNEQELVSFCESLSCFRKSIEGRIGIITGSGGHGAMAVDFCDARGLSVSEFSASRQDALRARLSPSISQIASLGNPLDLTGSATDDDFIYMAESLSRQADVDCILLLLLPYLPGITLDLGARLGQIYENEGKPMIAYVPHVERYRMLIEGFEQSNVPVSPSIEGAVLMAEAMKRCKTCELL
ncbi:MAG: CoA-binding protein [Deltaproteobacteria bacterium]|nr:CoA-binding protein [Deltaproteobacteria bacterium]